MFDPFWSTKGLNGTGLGLAVSFGIVNGHNGSIRVRSKEGRGTEFRIVLPFASESPKDLPQPSMLPSRSLTVLVVDDMEPIVDLLRNGLSLYNQKVICASSGREAVEVFRSRHVDVIVCDYIMPGMNGLQTASAIKQYAELNDIQMPPFILLSGLGKEIVDLENPGDTGVQKILEKPVEIKSLVDTLMKMTEL